MAAAFINSEVLEVQGINSPENRATLIINLVNEIQILELQNNERDLGLYFMQFGRAVLDSLLRSSPELTAPDLVTA